MSTLRTLPTAFLILLLGPVGATAQDGETQRLQPEDRAAGDLFACSLSLSGETLLAGSLLDDDRGADSGSAYVFELGPGGWVQSAKLIGDDTAAGDQFGFSVYLDGDLALVGAPLAGPGGAAYRFERVRPGEGAWRQTARWAGAEAGADAGAAVALLPGRFALVGAPLDDSGGRVDAGAVLAFPLGGGGPVRLEASTPRDRAGLGWSLAAAGGLVAAGAPWADSPLSGAGAVTLFTAGPGGFQPLVELTAPDAAPFQSFGYSVALGGDLLVVGAPRDGQHGPSAGAIYLFRVRNGAATLEAKIPGTMAGDQYGIAVAVAADGRSFAVGAHRGRSNTALNVGFVDVFERRGDLWISERRIQPATASPGDGVGIDVSLSGAGIAVGAYKDDAGGGDAGAAYVDVPLPPPPPPPPPAPLSADLYLAVRYLSGTSAVPGEGAVHEVEIGNLGPSDAPPFSFAGGGLGPAFVAPTWTCTRRRGAACVPAAGSGGVGGTLTLPAGSRVVYRIESTVAPGATGTLVLAGSLGPLAGLDPDPSNNADRVVTPLHPVTDLVAGLGAAAPAPGFFAGSFRPRQDGEPLRLRPGETAVFEARFSNAGPSDARDARIVATLPRGLGGAGWTCTASGGAACSPSGAGVLDTRADLPVGSEVVYSFAAVALAGFLGPQPVSVSVVPGGGFEDPDPSDNRAETPGPLLLPVSGLALTLEAQGSFVEGSVMTYELLVANGSALPVADAPSDEVVFPLPLPLIAVTAVADAGTAAVASPSLVTWNGDLPGGEVVTIRIQARIPAGTRGSSVAAQATATVGQEVSPSSPPGVLEPAPTIFVVMALLAIPTASGWGLALLALLLAAGALAFLGRSS